MICYPNLALIKRSIQFTSKIQITVAEIKSSHILFTETWNRNGWKRSMEIINPPAGSPQAGGF